MVDVRAELRLMNVLCLKEETLKGLLRAIQAWLLESETQRIRSASGGQEGQRGWASWFA
jgi:hypothetical protein